MSRKTGETSKSALPCVSLSAKTTNLPLDPSLPRVGRGGARWVQPYKSELFPLYRYRNSEMASASSESLYQKFLKYKSQQDFVGMHLVRKLLCKGTTDPRRFANYKDGKYHVRTGSNGWSDLPKREVKDDERAESTRIFGAVLRDVTKDDVYAKMLSEYGASCRQGLEDGEEEVMDASQDSVIVKEKRVMKVEKKDRRRETRESTKEEKHEEPAKAEWASAVDDDASEKSECKRVDQNREQPVEDSKVGSSESERISEVSEDATTEVPKRKIRNRSQKQINEDQSDQSVSDPSVSSPGGNGSEDDFVEKLQLKFLSLSDEKLEAAENASGLESFGDREERAGRLAAFFGIGTTKDIDSTRKRNKRPTSAKKAIQVAPADQTTEEALRELNDTSIDQPAAPKKKKGGRPKKVVDPALEREPVKKPRQSKYLPDSDRAIDLSDVNEESTVVSIDDADVTLTSIDPDKMERYLQRLSSQTRESLDFHALRFGISPASYTKPDLISAISAHITRTLLSPPPKSILAIDCGLKSIAVARITGGPIPHIVQWQLINPDVPPEYDPRIYAEKCRKILDGNVFNMHSDVVVVERNYWGRSSNGRIVDKILQLRCVETLLVGMIAERGSYINVQVESLLPSMVSYRFGMRKRAEAVRAMKGLPPKYDQVEKKRIAVEIVRKWLDERRVVGCSDRTRELFGMTRKKDDLADALLMAVAWNDWWRAARMEGRRFLA